MNYILHFKLFYTFSKSKITLTSPSFPFFPVSASGTVRVSVCFSVSISTFSSISTSPSTIFTLYLDTVFCTCNFREISISTEKPSSSEEQKECTPLDSDWCVKILSLQSYTPELIVINRNSYLIFRSTIPWIPYSIIRYDRIEYNTFY